MHIQRLLVAAIKKRIGQQKVLLLYGTRRAGKTFILQQLFKLYEAQSLFLRPGKAGQTHNIQL
jgi:predicted AAA+ superfamily ATPase